MSNGRTFYLPKDVGWWRRENVVVLADEFGPVGPAVVDWLFCEAGAQRAAADRAERAEYGGQVKSGVNAVKRGIGADDVDQVRDVIERAAQVGALDDLEWLDDRRFVCRVSGWRSDVERVLTREDARQRKRRQRDRERHATSHPSRDVTPGHVERKRERKKDNDNDTSDANASDSARAGAHARDATAVDRDQHPDHMRLSTLLADLVAENGSRRPTDTQIAGWCRDVRLMVERDGRTLEQIERAIRWCQADEFWRGNVLSMRSLRKQYDRLRLQAMRERGTDRAAGNAAVLAVLEGGEAP